MSENDYKPSSPIAQLGGAKRKNGHKSNCTCHICENIKNKIKRGGYQEDIEKAKLKKNGGSKKKNGHKPNCSCPICKNMKHSKKGGADADMNNDDDSDSDSDTYIDNDTDMSNDADNVSSSDEEIQTAGRKKKSKRLKKKRRKGGQDPDEENQLGDIEEGNVKGISDPNLQINETPASDNEYDTLDAAEKGEAGTNIVGGTRKRRGTRKSNNHKPKCGCPICKNMKGGKKTRRRRNKKRSYRRR